MDRRLILTALVGVATGSFGCDSNPNGPSAPSVPPPGAYQPQPEPELPEAKGKNRKVPLRQVGQPISLREPGRLEPLG
ncbi:hypothetical protein [Singulisphaera sp. PoT]|uniref:hypothetical protein n=1 Tax=Singulisphaera sp. PoT TaxID=3411797 RepID=UPI003BF50D68